MYKFPQNGIFRSIICISDFDEKNRADFQEGCEHLNTHKNAEENCFSTSLPTLDTINFNFLISKAKGPFMLCQNLDYEPK